MKATSDLPLSALNAPRRPASKCGRDGRASEPDSLLPNAVLSVLSRADSLMPCLLPNAVLRRGPAEST